MENTVLGLHLEKLISLFFIYLLFVVLSASIGLGVYLIEPTYAMATTGSLLILTSLSILYAFLNEFVVDTK